MVIFLFIWRYKRWFLMKNLILIWLVSEDVSWLTMKG